MDRAGDEVVTAPEACCGSEARGFESASTGIIATLPTMRRARKAVASLCWIVMATLPVSGTHLCGKPRACL
jgi:hypothetical protein